MTYTAIKKIPPPEVRIAISLQTLPTIEPKSVPKPSPIVQQTPIKPKELINKPQITPTPTPPAPVIAPSRPITASVPVPAVVQTPQAPIKVPIAEPIVAKAPPPPKPEPKAEYKYPHKSQAQSILKDNIVCTKNMKRLKVRGTILLSFDLTPEGDAKRITVTQSSGNDVLDESVTQQIKTLAPLLPKPAETVTFDSFAIEFKGCQ